MSSPLLLYRRLLAHRRYLTRRSLFDYTAMSSIAVAHTRYRQEDPYYSVPSINCWRTRCIDQQQQQSVASATLTTPQQSVRNTTTLRTTPRTASTFVGIKNIYIWGISVGYSFCGPERWIGIVDHYIIRNDSLERR